ncbi:hypothetical protein KA005_49480 [bacterium]|nr:hypothetical protein [bacterium]
MAFVSAVTSQGVQGNKKVSKGTYANASNDDTGGDIDTALIMCESIVLVTSSSDVTSSGDVVNETLPVAGNAVTIVTSGSSDGYWIAEGY